MNLQRRLGTTDAVVIGLGSMIGAGVFVAFAPASAAAGAGLLIGLGIAAVVAFGNATSSAQLAAVYPTSGGTYSFGRERLGPWPGFVAGWCFVIGKTASCAAMALAAASYAVPGPWWAQRLVAVAAVVVLAALNCRGVTKTAFATRLLVGVTLLALGLIVATIGVGWGGEHAVRAPEALVAWGGPYGVLQAAALLFFAFAGYARIATLGEEVLDPARVIPRAIPIALAITVAIYLAVGLTALLALGPERLAASAAPLVDAVVAVGAGWLAPVVRVAAVVAALGALLTLLAGVGRTTLAMARGGDLPRWLAAVHPRFGVPHHAELAIAAVVSGLIIVTDLRAVIGFSSFGVLLYYAVANASAFTQPAEQRRWPKALQVVGLAGCLVLATTVPRASLITGATVLAVGVLGRALVLSRRGVRDE